MTLLSRRQFTYLLLGSSLGSTLTLAQGWRADAVTQPAQITPTTPQLGDTLRVIVPKTAAQNPPSIKMGSKSYSMVALDQNYWRVLIPTTPLDTPGRKQIQVTDGNQVLATLAITLRDRKFPVQRIWLPPGKDDLGSDHEFDRVDAFKKLVTPEKFWQGKFARPNQGPITSGYGIRRYYNGVFAKDYFHRGVDYAGGYGSPVVAPAAGRVALVGRVAQGFELHGNTVGLDHGQGVVSIFIHLSRIDVKEGQMLKVGQVLGAIGATGAATGPHLHWGLYVQGACVDPVPWREQGFQ
jgi:murein DD-endopeptidase MepM/ murein hydrolase activator NlpD